MKDIFGSKEIRSGAKVVTQNEWNGINGAITGFKLGDSNFNVPAEAGPGGMQQGIDTFFFPHIGVISDTDKTEAVIGIDRQEEWYPYVDSLSVPNYVVRLTFRRDGAGDIYRVAASDVTWYARSVRFYEPSTLTVTPAATVGDPKVVGYQWDLIPTVGNPNVKDAYEFEVLIQYLPAEIFETDPQAVVKEYDLGVVEDAWSPAQSVDTATEYDALQLVADKLGVSKSAYFGATEEYPIYSYILWVPVARYDWNTAQTELVRSVQLLFGSQFSGGGIPVGSNTVNAGIPHPFKSRIKPDYPTTVEVGFLRPDWKDNITIEDPDSDNDDVIEFPDVEEIELDAAPGPYNDYYVYYDIYWSETLVPAQWTASLEKTQVWPPAQDTAGADGTMTGNIIRQIGMAKWDSENETYVWYQHMFEDPTETPLQPRGDFEAMYINDGKVRIFAGDVATFNNDTATVAQADFDLRTGTDIWVEITSIPSSGDPSVTINAALQSGTYPGLYQKISDAEYKFNYLIGKIANYEYVPKHLGKLNIDNTLLMPDVAAGFTVTEDKPRIMFFHDDQVTTIGDTGNDRLLYSEFVEWEIRGGGTQHLSEGTALAWYGLTENASLQFFDETGVAGSGLGTGSVTFSFSPFDYEWDHGIVQASDLGSPAYDFIIDSGTNIEVDYDSVASKITINGPGTQNSVEISSGNLQLVNDEASPGNNEFYGTDGTGTKGWNPFTQITVITDAQLDSSNNLQVKTRTAYVWNPGTESSFTTITGWATTDCS